jgi:hypothetical protein
MSLTAEDLAQLGEFVKSEIEKVAGAAIADAAAPKPQVNDEPQNQPENQPDFYVHLANGKVLVSKDSGSTHMVDPDNGETVQVIGHYPVGV